MTNSVKLSHKTDHQKGKKYITYKKGSDYTQYQKKHNSARIALQDTKWAKNITISYVLNADGTFVQDVARMKK